MTREEAVKTLDEMFDFYDELHENTDGECGYEEMQAITVAISALQAEPYTDIVPITDKPIGEFDASTGIVTYYGKTRPSDLISRTEAKKAICKACLNGESILRCKQWDCPYLMALYYVPSDKGGDAEMNEAKSPFMQQTPSEDGSDLISRAEAICAVLGLAQLNGRVPIDSVTFQIKALPSADRPTDRLAKAMAEELTYEEVIRGEEYARGYADGLKEQIDRPSGEWLMFDGLYCSNCHYKLQTTGIPTYCPSCGARMENTK